MLDTIKKNGSPLSTLVSKYPVDLHKKMDIEMYIKELTAMVNGDTKVLNVAPIISNGFTLVPLRFISEVFGCTVYYKNGIIDIVITTNGARSHFNNNGI